jgi:hypothetical protein
VLKHDQDHLKEIEMIDNAGLATTVIGLRAIQQEQDLYEALVPQPRQVRKARGHAIRLVIAQTLRHLADSLEASQPSAGRSRA